MPFSAETQPQPLPALLQSKFAHSACHMCQIGARDGFTRHSAEWDMLVGSAALTGTVDSTLMLLQPTKQTVELVRRLNQVLLTNNCSTAFEGDLVLDALLHNNHVAPGSTWSHAAVDSGKCRR